MDNLSAVSGGIDVTDSKYALLPFLPTMIHKVFGDSVPLDFIKSILSKIPQPTLDSLSIERETDLSFLK